MCEKSTLFQHFFSESVHQKTIHIDDIDLATDNRTSIQTDSFMSRGLTSCNDKAAVWEMNGNKQTRKQ